MSEMTDAAALRNIALVFTQYVFGDWFISQEHKGIGKRAAVSDHSYRHE